jgi:adenosylcobinamide-GDP ribazoletransferase
MASGTQERKRQAMKDVSLGAAGVFFLITAFFTLFLLISKLGGWADSPMLLFWTDEIPLVWGFVLAEMSAKLAMVTVMTIGPSSHPGMGSAFVQTASPEKLLVGAIIAVLIAFPLAGIYSVIVLLGIVAGGIVAMISKRHFGGVGGDSFGAANEFGRILALLAWVILI